MPEPPSNSGVSQAISALLLLTLLKRTFWGGLGGVGLSTKGQDNPGGITVTIAPEETKSYSWTWDQTNNGEQVPANTYGAQAYVGTSSELKAGGNPSSPTATRSAVAEFVIRE